ncbi:glycosyltransferase (plasmid) [Bradyrhizobium barranii subsp. apii]|uniref:glycosyltransferase n=1 Tax=Bradyrhizobium barranii TaxID=2992140 RepID=UPI001AA16665|nr:cellulose synthase catalytic subunit [Bradyrhizobium barranii]UPU01359.1 glycosyltransferase [Bradyrhizobium barranii subsp. apii]
MLILSPLLAALAGAAIIIGLRLTVLPLLDSSRWYWRALLLGLAAILSWRYVVWRFTETLVPLDWTADALVSWGFATLEGMTVLSSSIAFVILSRVKERTAEADQHAEWWLPGEAPSVDIFIATYNESLEILERTIIGAKAARFPKLRVFVLDDGRRDWLRQACERHSVGYIVRSDNAHAKAGNINHALAARDLDPDRPDFVAILDADFVPHVDFIDRTVALFHDSRVGLVQTPQHFFNPDPIQHNLGITAGYPDEQRHFFDNVEPARDAWGIAICCGTSSVLRVRAIHQIGLLPTQSVTEDFLLTLKLAENGWQTVYLNEPLTEGLAPEGLKEYIVQRGRWCLGLMQIARNSYNPFGSNRLGLMHRISLIDSLLYWLTTFPFRLASLICPLLYWWLGITIVNASLVDIIRYYVPYYVMVLVALNWLSKGLFIPIVNDTAQLIAAWPICRAAARGLLTRGPHRFSVTAKGGDRTRVVVQWSLMRPFLILFGLTVGGLIVPLNSDFVFNTSLTADDGVAIVLFWTVYNILVLVVAIAACIERPRYNRPQRQVLEPITLTIGDDRHRGWLVNLGPEGARISGPFGLSVGATGNLTIPAIGDVEARVLAPTRDGYRLKFSPSVEQRAQIIEKLHTARALPGSDRGDIIRIVRELARALTH